MTAQAAALTNASGNEANRAADGGVRVNNSAQLWTPRPYLLRINTTPRELSVSKQVQLRAGETAAHALHK